MIDGCEFIEIMGRYFDEGGNPRIAGRLFAFLLLSEEPRSLDELAEELQVSKASMSANARMLEVWGFAERITRPGDRRDYYRMAPTAHQNVLTREIGRLQQLNERLGRAQATGTHSPVVGARLERMIKNNTKAVNALHQLLAEGDEYDPAADAAPAHEG
ncbi:MAG TPA: MarR family transcriptional regulator [Longimicrobium sp.]|jgi:DNA-binding transcriptional regulator GbsR (MarR family)